MTRSCGVGGGGVGGGLRTFGGKQCMCSAVRTAFYNSFVGAIRVRWQQCTFQYEHINTIVLPSTCLYFSVMHRDRPSLSFATLVVFIHFLHRHVINSITHSMLISPSTNDHLSKTRAKGPIEYRS